MRDKTKPKAIVIIIIAAAGVLGLIGWGIYELVQYLKKDLPSPDSRTTKHTNKQNIIRDFKTYLKTTTI